MRVWSCEWQHIGDERCIRRLSVDYATHLVISTGLKAIRVIVSVFKTSLILPYGVCIFLASILWRLFGVIIFLGILTRPHNGSGMLTGPSSRCHYKTFRTENCTEPFSLTRRSEFYNRVDSVELRPHYDDDDVRRRNRDPRNVASVSWWTSHGRL